MNKITGIIICLLFTVPLFGQNKKPITKSDTLIMEVSDSVMINVLLNDTDPNGDPMKLTKFNGTAIPLTGLKSMLCHDTIRWTANAKGDIWVKAFREMNKTYFYYSNDGKSGAGPKGSLTIIIKGKQMDDFYLFEFNYSPMVFTESKPCIYKYNDTGDFWGFFEMGNKYHYGFIDLDTSVGFYFQAKYSYLGDPTLGEYTKAYDLKCEGQITMKRKEWLFIRRKGCRHID